MLNLSLTCFSYIIYNLYSNHYKTYSILVNLSYTLFKYRDAGLTFKSMSKYSSFCYNLYVSSESTIKLDRQVSISALSVNYSFSISAYYNFYPNSKATSYCPRLKLYTKKLLDKTRNH